MNNEAVDKKSVSEEETPLTKLLHIERENTVSANASSNEVITEDRQSSLGHIERETVQAHD